jgi:hypothetical protein
VKLREYAFSDRHHGTLCQADFTGGYRYTWDNKMFTGYDYSPGPAAYPDGEFMVRYPER